MANNFNYNRLDGDHSDEIGHRQMAVLRMASDHGANPWNSLIMWSFKEPKLFCVLWNLLERKKSDEFHIKVLF